jgi:hypothetical protein
MKMTSKPIRIPQMAKFGIADFPTPADVAEQQKRLLGNLENSSILPTLYEGMEDCSLNHCGRHNCSDACRFGAYRRKCKSISPIYRLLAMHDGPLCEVRVRRTVWSQLFGDLQPSLGAINKLNRRALDNLYNPGLVAVGAIKVSVANGAYICEIHQIVAGAEEDDVKRVFVPSHKVEATSFIWTKEIENIGPVIYSVLDHGLRPWKDPRQHESTNEAPNAAKSAGWSTVSPVTLAAPSKATKDCWREYYAWRLGLPYLKKAPRTIRPKVRKKRRYPYWLEAHMFGGGRWTHIDPQGMDYVPKRLRIQGGSSDDPTVDYFSLDDE